MTTRKITIEVEKLFTYIGRFKGTMRGSRSTYDYITKTDVLQIRVFDERSQKWICMIGTEESGVEPANSSIMESAYLIGDQLPNFQRYETEEQRQALIFDCVDNEYDDSAQFRFEA